MLCSFVTFYGWEPVFWLWFSMTSAFALGWALARATRKTLATGCILFGLLLGLLWWFF